MGNCKDCKHWYDEECMLIGTNENVGTDGFTLEIHASDDHGLFYSIKTGPMFGCVKFEGK